MELFRRLKHLFGKGAFVLVFVLACSFNGKAEKADDIEIWTFVGAETQWKKVEFSLTSANFFTGGGGWFLNFTQFSFDFKNNRDISFGVAYKQEYFKFPTFTRAEYRPMLHVYYSKQLGDFEISDRNRMEFRIFEDKMFNRYRNRVQLKYNVKNKVIPYISTEAFFYFDQIRYSRQRSTLGAVVPIKSVKVNLFGVHQVDRLFAGSNTDNWLNRLILGTSLSYRF